MQIPDQTARGQSLEQNKHGKWFEDVTFKSNNLALLKMVIWCVHSWVHLYNYTVITPYFIFSGLREKTFSYSILILNNYSITIFYILFIIYFKQYLIRNLPPHLHYYAKPSIQIMTNYGRCSFQTVILLDTTAVSPTLSGDYPGSQYTSAHAMRYCLES